MHASCKREGDAKSAEGRRERCGASPVGCRRGKGAPPPFAGEVASGASRKGKSNGRPLHHASHGPLPRKRGRIIAPSEPLCVVRGETLLSLGGAEGTDRACGIGE